MSNKAFIGLVVGAGLLVGLPLAAQVIPQPGPPQVIGGAYNATTPTLSDLQAGWVQLDANGNLKVVLGSSSGAAGYPAGATPITGNAAGTTGAVVGTLAKAAGKFTYICGLNVSAIGGTAAVGPVTVAGLTGSSMVFQLASLAAGNQLVVPFNPCVPSSDVNTDITITTTADGTASGVSVNSWGYRQ